MKKLAALISAAALCVIPSMASPAGFVWKWVLTVNKDSVYIGEHTDDESNAIFCDKPLTGFVNFHLHVETDPPTSDPPWKTHMTIRSGAATVTVAGEATPNEDAGGSDVIVKLPVKSPVVAAFGKTGALKMTAMGYTSDSPSVPVAQSAKLVKLCGG